MFIRLNHYLSREDAKLVYEAIPEGTPKIVVGKSPRITVWYLDEFQLGEFREYLLAESERQLGSELREKLSSAWLHCEMFIARQDGETIIVSDHSARQFTAVRKLYGENVDAEEQVAIAYSHLVRGLGELERLGPTMQTTTAA